VTKQTDLIEYFFERQENPLSAELLQWMNTSSRFTVFVETYRDKIRKKIRVTRETESLLDVRGELEVAYRLLHDRRFTAEYEPYASARGRGPDFAVTYRTNLRFNIEVSRMRADENEATENNSARLLRILLSKLGQMQAGMANVLMIHTRRQIAQAINLEQFMQEIKTRAEGKEPLFYELSHYANPAAFYKDFLHLSGLILWSPGAQLWVNKQARPALDATVLRRLRDLAASET
jgi:hypothetical protein